MTFLREVYAGDELPRGHGVAWRRFERDSAITAPVPFNLVIGQARDAFRWLRYRKPSALDRLQVAASRTGWNTGYQQGLRDGEREFCNRVLAELDQKRNLARTI